VAAKPEVVIHQLTDLAGLRAPGGPVPGALRGNSRVRIEGTRNLVEATVAAGATRMIAQSICWLYAEGPLPHVEADPLNRPNDGSDTSGVDAVLALEAAVTGTPGLEGLVLRYGRFYGPGTGTETAPRSAPVHVEAAAHAALLAVTRGEPGIYNVAVDDGYVSTVRARTQFGWSSDFRVTGLAKGTAS
jgi:nucleoside-diphosphate-sugar epimerase